MEKEEILERIKTLDAKVVEVIKGLTDSQNHLFKADMYGFVLFWCQFGELLSFLRGYYDYAGWPASFLEGKVNHRFLLMLDDVTRCCYHDLNELENLSDFETSGIYNNVNVKNLLDEVILRASTGEYIVPNDENLANVKKDVVCRSLDMFYKLLQGKMEKQDYVFENFNIMDENMDNYQAYKDQVGIEISYLSPNKYGDLEIVYSGPQFGKEIEACFLDFKKNSLLEEKIADGVAKIKTKKYNNLKS